MTIKKLRLLEPFDMLREFENVFQPRAEESAPVPRTDIAETDKGYEISLEVSGVDKNDLSLEVKNNVLNVNGEKKFGKSNEGKNYIATERVYGKFTRRFRLPENADEDGIKADSKNGVLRIIIPKMEPKEEKFLRIEVR